LYVFSLVPIVVRGEAVSALRPAGILPAAGNKGKMPSPREMAFLWLNTYQFCTPRHLSFRFGMLPVQRFRLRDFLNTVDGKYRPDVLEHLRPLVDSPDQH
jgi:hypothetical protein